MIDAIARRYGRRPSELMAGSMEQLAMDFACFRSGVDVEREQSEQFEEM